MPDILSRSVEETLVIAQIEEPEAVAVAEEIAAVEGIDGLFVGPADLTVAYGEQSLDNAPLRTAYARVGAACREHGKGFATWIPTASTAGAVQAHGVGMFLVGSELSWIVAGARATAAALRDPDSDQAPIPSR
jgi:2-keto-3-deoxy-L-rhamnonate aldolase RhmA